MKGRGNTPKRVVLKDARERKKEKEALEKDKLAWEKLDNEEDVEDVAAKPRSSRHRSVKPKPKKESPHEEMKKAFAPDMRLPTPAWDALFASKKRDFVRAVLEGLVEPWDTQGIYNMANAVLFDGKLPHVDVQYNFAYFEVHPTWGATTSIERATGKVIRIRVNPRLGEPDSRVALINAIVHECIHVAIAWDCKFNATIHHGLDFGLYSALASEKTGLVISAAFDDSEIDLTLIDLPTRCVAWSHDEWCAHWKAVAEALEKATEEGVVEVAWGKKVTTIKARCRVRYEDRADKGVREPRAKSRQPAESEDENNAVRQPRAKSSTRRTTRKR